MFFGKTFSEFFRGIVFINNNPLCFSWAEVDIHKQQRNPVVWLILRTLLVLVQGWLSDIARVFVPVCHEFRLLIGSGHLLWIP